MNKKSFQIISVIIYLCIPGFIMAQNADDIIAKHIKAHGGEKNWTEVESLKITGEFTAFSEVKNFVRIKTKAGQYYANLHLGQHEVEEGFNGTNGWTIDPWQEILYPRELTKGEVNVFKQKAEFFTPFYKYKEKGHEVEFVGKENVDGIDVYILKLKRLNGNVETWYLDAETYLEYKCESNWIDFAYVQAAESYFEDFQNVDGIVIPFYIERIFRQRNRMTQIAKVEINAEVDIDLFEMPRSEGFGKVSFMKGEWDVKLAIWTRRQTWADYSTIRSDIEFKTRNLLQESFSYEGPFPQTEIKNLSYSELNGEYTLTLYNNLDFGLSVFKGKFVDDSLVLKSVEMGEVENANAPRRQFVYAFENNDSFSIEQKVSIDGEKIGDQKLGTPIIESLNNL